MSTPKSELYVITSAKKLAGYVLDLTEKCPKKFRYSYLVRIEECCLSIVSLLYEANDIKLGNSLRSEKQSDVKTKLRILDFLSEEAMKHGCFLLHQYEVVSSYLYDCSHALEKWVISDQKRIEAGLQ